MSAKKRSAVSESDIKKGEPKSEEKRKLDRVVQTYVENASIGIIETLGIIPIVEAMDAMPKAARVEIMRYEYVGGGRVAVCVKGEVAAVRVAISTRVSRPLLLARREQTSISHCQPRPTATSDSNESTKRGAIT